MAVPADSEMRFGSRNSALPSTQTKVLSLGIGPRSGAGWVPFDPTNSLFGGASLIRVAGARDPSQAAPLTGSWFAAPGDFHGLHVEVTVRRRKAFSSPQSLPGA